MLSEILSQEELGPEVLYPGGVPALLAVHEDETHVHLVFEYGGEALMPMIGGLTWQERDALTDEIARTLLPLLAGLHAKVRDYGGREGGRARDACCRGWPGTQGRGRCETTGVGRQENPTARHKCCPCRRSSIGSSFAFALLRGMQHVPRLPRQAACAISHRQQQEAASAPGTRGMLHAEPACGTAIRHESRHDSQAS